MNIVQTIAKNTGALLISQIAGYMLGFFFVMDTARYLGYYPLIPTNSLMGGVHTK